MAAGAAQLREALLEVPPVQAADAALPEAPPVEAQVKEALPEAPQVEVADASQVREALPEAHLVSGRTSVPVGMVRLEFTVS